VRHLTSVVLRQAGAQVVRDTNVKVLGIETRENVNIFHGRPYLRRRGYNVAAFAAIGLAEARIRPSGYDAAAFATIGLAEAGLRPSGYDAAAFATIGLAEPKQA
jgi:hypothetical protein